MFEVLLEKTAEKDLRRLSREMHDRITVALASLAQDARPAGAKKLTGSKNDWRLRVGDYRVLYEIADAVRSIRVFRIRHRREAYRE